MTTTISRNSVGFSELLDHTQQESRRWHDWFNQHPQALDVPIDIAGSATVRDLLSHIVFVDLLFAEWLLRESAVWEKLGSAYSPPSIVKHESSGHEQEVSQELQPSMQRKSIGCEIACALRSTQLCAEYSNR